MRGPLLSSLLAAVLLAAHAPPLRAQDAQPVPTRHHVIVVLDRSGSMDDGGQPRWDVLRRAVTVRLREAVFTPGRVVQGRSLLNPAAGDVLSVVSFGLEAGARDFSQFIRVENGMLRRRNAPRSTFDALWSDIESYGDGGFFTGHLTGLSLAPPLALEHEGRTGAAADPPVHRTFVVLVTDEEYNGLGLVNEELRELSRTPLAGAVPGARARMDSIRLHYDFVERKVDEGPIVLKVYEVVPQRSFHVGALWRFNTDAFEFRRVDGGFRSHFALRREPGAPPTLRTERIEALLMDGGAVLDRREISGEDDALTVDFTLPDGARADALAVQLRFRVRQVDGVYGMRLMDPDDPALRSSLAVTVPVALEPPHLILGTLPVGPATRAVARVVGVRDDAGVARLWNWLILGLAVLATVGVVFWWAMRASTITSPRELVNGRMERAW